MKTPNNRAVVDCGGQAVKKTSIAGNQRAKNADRNCLCNIPLPTGNSIAGDQ